MTQIPQKIVNLKDRPCSSSTWSHEKIVVSYFPLGVKALMCHLGKRSSRMSAASPPNLSKITANLNVTCLPTYLYLNFLILINFNIYPSCSPFNNSGWLLLPSVSVPRYFFFNQIIGLPISSNYCIHDIIHSDHKLYLISCNYSQNDSL